MDLQRDSSYMRHRTALLVLGSLLAGGILPPLSATAQVVGYAHFAGDFYVFELRGDSSPIQPEAVGSTGLARVAALAVGPDGSLYAAAAPLFGSGQLWSIDPASLTATQIGELGVSLDIFKCDLTADATGGLWLVTGGQLYSVDRSTGQATPAPAVAADLVAVAHRNGILYAIAGGIDPVRWWLVTIDPASGELFPVTALGIADRVEGSSLDLLGIKAMDFDDDGGLWALVEYTSGVIDPPIIHTEIYYFADPSSGSATSRSRFGGHEYFWETLAVAGSSGTVVAVPALEPWSLVVFAVAMAVAMLFVARRRSGGASLQASNGQRPAPDLAHWDS